MAHFPPLSLDARAMEQSLRRAAGQMTEDQRNQTYAQLSKAGQGYTPTTFSIEDDNLIAHQDRETLAFPRPVRADTYKLIVAGYRRWMLNRYTLPGFVEVDLGDRVVDCGAYIGGFAVAALEAGAGAAICIDPAPENTRCTARNLAAWPQGAVQTAALHDCADTRSLPDYAFSTDCRAADWTTDLPEVPAKRLDQIMDPDVDFLKVHANGDEPLVVAGLGACRPAKIAVDVSWAKTEADLVPIRKTLSDMGYQLRRRSAVLFGRQTAARVPARVIPPKTIFAMWVNYSTSATPPVVDLCLTRWKTLNPDHQVKMITHADVQEICSRLPGAGSMIVQARADVTRYWLMAKHGGIWTDATVLPTAPVSDWLDQYTDDTGFCMAERGDRPNLPFANWFLRGHPRSPMTQSMWRFARAYWQIPRQKMSQSDWRRLYALHPDLFADPAAGMWLPVAPYFWSHLLFKDMLARSSALNDLWRSVPRVDAAAALELQKQLVEGVVPDKVPTGWLHKLDHRTPYAASVLEGIAQKMQNLDRVAGRI